MGILKQKMLDTQERRRDALLAKVLRIPLHELDQTNWEISEIETDEGIVTEVLIKFSDSPRDILDKIGVEPDSEEYSIDANALENAKVRYTHYADTLGVLYPELLYSETEELDAPEKDGVFGIHLKFGPDTPYERLAKIKHNGLTEDYVTWLPYMPD